MARPNVLRRNWGEAASPVRARDVVLAVGVAVLFTAVVCFAYLHGIARPALISLGFGVMIGGLVGLGASHHVDVNTEPRGLDQRVVRAIVRRTGSSFLAFAVDAVWIGLVGSYVAFAVLGHLGFTPPLNRTPTAEIIVVLISGGAVAGMVTAIILWLRFCASRAGDAAAADANL